MSPMLSDLDREPECSGDPCRHGQVACPVASACHAPERRERIGRYHRWERVLIEHPTAVAVLSVVAFALLVWGTKP